MNIKINKRKKNHKKELAVRKLKFYPSYMPLEQKTKTKTKYRNNTCKVMRRFKNTPANRTFTLSHV